MILYNSVSIYQYKSVQNTKYYIKINIKLQTRISICQGSENRPANLKCVALKVEF